MKVYPEVPMWWYGAVLLASFGMSMATLYTGGSGMPWWALIFGGFNFPFYVLSKY